MKSIWIVDDDQSIRFVLEKALTREELPTRSFSQHARGAGRAGAAATTAAGAGVGHPHAGRLRAWTC